LLDDLANHLSVLNVGDANELEVVKERTVEFNDLYQKYQQFSVTVQRATSKAVIKVNGKELSVADAIVIRDILIEKINHFKRIQEYTINKGIDRYKLINLDDIYKETEKIRLDIKTLNSEIEYALWNIEVS
jgi:uncharacterized protein YktA (UPF0223 family)